ncbi:MAG: DUF3365 domain-containing protein [Pseudomonadales bacterium]|nr:DUF3365 domain-containing protein [Pseudomonadales bacterium]
MGKLHSLVVLLFFVCLSSCLTAEEYAGTAPADPDVLANEAGKIASAFASRLKPRLQAAMVKGGPAYAIEVCSTEAPSIAQQLSAETGWSVKRVSLRHRNPNARPDSFEKEVLQSFDQRHEAGEPAATISHTEVVSGKLRFLKAQGVEPLCLTCHGQQLPESVARRLSDLYPEDTARGYQAGEVRGAISLISPGIVPAK